MDVQEVIAQARDTLTVKRVFGDPYERRRESDSGRQGTRRRRRRRWPAPGGRAKRLRKRVRNDRSTAGAFVIRGDQVSWRPAVDVNRIVLAGQVVGVVELLTIRAVVKARAHPECEFKPHGNV
jgi:hypothetical protein